VVGIVAILILALLMDGVLVVLERLLTPWTRAAAGGRSERKNGTALLTEPKTGSRLPHTPVQPDPGASA
jgi:osmoprotectant transport system permease protein